jgi:hypothetical protein
LFYENENMKKEIKVNMKTKKIFLVGLITFALCAGVGLVNAETTVETNWNGAGNLDINFQSGDDARSQFWTGGSSGTYKATDDNNNPYGYGVDTTRVQIKADIANGGFIGHQYDRQDSHVGMYGPAGQRSYSFITTDDTAGFAMNIRSNFADMIIGNYGFQNNNQYTATGNHILSHVLTTENSGAFWTINATGTSIVNHMSDEASGSNSFEFGKGCGCYTNANVDIVGSGTYNLDAVAPNQIKTDTGITTDGYLGISANFNSGFSFGNFALSGN